MKMYIVRVEVEVEIPVACETEAEAREIAREHIEDEMDNVYLPDEVNQYSAVRRIRSLQEVPKDMLGCCLWTEVDYDVTPECVFAEPIPENADNVEPKRGGLFG